jgi:Rad3-related DNA helicase
LDAPPEIRTPRLAPPPERLGGLNKRVTRKLYSSLNTASELLQVEEARRASAPAVVNASAPWRTGAYDIGVDVRVDTTYQQRGRHFATTAATIEAFHERLTDRPRPGGLSRAVAVFFPSYSYAESIQRALLQNGSALKTSLPPRQADLATQASWVEESLALSDALFLVLGSSFAEGIDVLGGRVSHGLVVGPALPEVNAVQRARLATLSPLGRDAAFRRVYQVPGIQKVNQALGRLVRAPGQRARVLLHCRRFADPGYASLLAPEYQFGREIGTDAELRDWLGR